MSGGDWKEMLVAVQDGDIKLVRYHIENGVDPNYEHPELMTTALIEAVSYDHVEIAVYLLSKGADPGQKAWLSKDSPMTLAKRAGNKELIEILKKHSNHGKGKFQFWK